MNNIFKKINNAKLTESEKQIGFNRLQAFIKNNPGAMSDKKSFTEKILSPFNDGIFLHHKILAATFAFIIIIGATGSTSVVANKSVPGDALYAFKINLNEKVETLTAISPEAKAVVEAQHINERLSEAEILSTENKLSEAIKIQLENKFSQDLQNTMVHVEKLNSNGDSKKADQVKADIEKSLQKHKEIVDKILENKKSKSDRLLQKTSTKTKLENNRVASMSAFSTEISTSTATSTGEANIQKEYLQIKNKSKDGEENKTPLLDETLKKILESREENRD